MKIIEDEQLEFNQSANPESITDKKAEFFYKSVLESKPDYIQALFNYANLKTLIFFSISMILFVLKTGCMYI